MKAALDQWIRKKHGIGGAADLKKWQSGKIKELIKYVCEKSTFYRKHLAGCKIPETEAEFGRLPMMSENNLCEEGLKMLCVSQGEIKRAVTLHTSGTGGRPKRLYFTQEDLELTVDFFCCGMREVVEEGDRAVVFLPCLREDSVGNLLLKSLDRMKVTGYGPGPVENPGLAVRMLQAEKADAFVGTPLQALALAEHAKAGKASLMLKRILVSTDYLADSVRKRIEQGLGCQVFNHFGITEAGLGCAVECQCHNGMHIRENDLLVEVIDPVSGRILPNGKRGEMVLTTLTRKGMPLIRYRTGDYCIMERKPCRCGSYLARIVKTEGRIKDRLKEGKDEISMALMDEILFSIDGLIDYGVKYQENEKILEVHMVFFQKEGGKAVLGEKMLRRMLAKRGFSDQACRLQVTWEETESWNPQYEGKRLIRRVG
ncbi:MAG: DVU_1553 family AMP-dependent CoA ligase [Ruminococcus sp.]|jgi:phenylacetate-CoA ligase